MQFIQTRSMLPVVFSVLALFFVRAASGQTEILKRSYDNNRTGANKRKTFTPAKIREFGLKRLFKLQLEQDDARLPCSKR
jgi:hypothetical protein